MLGWVYMLIELFQLVVFDIMMISYMIHRHTAPGEKQNNGKWSVSEHEMFMRALKKHPPKGQWGLFAIHIPGRVGYQV